MPSANNGKSKSAWHNKQKDDLSPEKNGLGQKRPNDFLVCKGSDYSYMNQDTKSVQIKIIQAHYKLITTSDLGCDQNILIMLPIIILFQIIFYQLKNTKIIKSCKDRYVYLEFAVT